MQGVWDAVVDAWPYSERAFFVALLGVTHSAVFWGSNALLYLCHRFGWFESCRIQGKRWPDAALVRHAILNIALSHVFTQWVAFWLIFPLAQRMGTDPTSRELPSLATVLWQLAFAVVFNDTAFYWAHRLLHASPLLYRLVHKQHHRFAVCIGVAAEYAHPVEQVLANFIPTFGGLALCGAHPLTFMLWIVIRILETVEAHSGYHFRYSPFSFSDYQGGADVHDFHHSVNKGNYGSFTTFWDVVCGTDAAYKAWKLKRAAGGGADGDAGRKEE